MIDIQAMVRKVWCNVYVWAFKLLHNSLITNHKTRKKKCGWPRMDKKAKICASLCKNKVATFFVMYFTHHCRNINHDIRCLFSVRPRREKAATLSLWRLPQILAFWSILQSLQLSLQHLNQSGGLHCWNLATSIIQVLLKTIGGRVWDPVSYPERVDFITWSFGPSHPGKKGHYEKEASEKKARAAFKFFILRKSGVLLKNEKLNFHFKSSFFC